MVLIQEEFMKRAGALLASLAALTPVVALLAPASASAATPSSGTVSTDAPAQWQFAPVGGTGGSTDSFQLKVELPAPASQLYKANEATGTDYAAVLRVKLVWAGGAPDDVVTLA